MKKYAGLLFFLVVLISNSAQAITLPKWRLDLNNLESITKNILPQILQDVVDSQGNFNLPDLKIHPCGHPAITCQLTHIKPVLNVSDAANFFSMEFAKNNRLLYRMGLPNASLSARLEIKALLIGQVIDFNFDLLAKGILPHANGETRLPGYEGALEVAFLNSPSGPDIKVEKPLNLQIESFSMKPIGSIERGLFRLVQVFTDINQRALELLNNQAKTLLNSRDFLQGLEKNFRKYLSRLSSFGDAIKQQGIQIDINSPTLSTDDKKGHLKGSLSITALNSPSSCAKDFAGIDYYSQNEIFKGQTTGLGLNLQTSLLAHILDVILKHPFGKDQKYSPLMCETGKSHFALGPFKLPYQWKITPFGKFKLFHGLGRDSNESLFTFKGRALLMLESERKFPRLYVTRSGKQEGGLVDFEMSFKLDSNHLEGTGLTFESFSITHAEGKIHLGILGKMGPIFSLAKRVPAIEAEIKEAFFTVGKKVLLFPSQIELPYSSELRLEEFISRRGELMFAWSLE